MAAYDDCRQHKRNTASALAFEADLERNLWTLYERLLDGTYRPGRSICFVVTRPKPREVWAAPFPDRVPHHLLYRHVGPRFEASFIADSCACIRGRGTLYAARRLEAKVRSITQNWSRPAWYLKCDIDTFFPSINKPILFEILAGRIPEPFWRELAATILFHDPRVDAEIQSAPEKLELIPAHKSLWHRPAHLGLPIGNLSSQFFANAYLDVLDQHAKHRLRCRHYLRYVDDFILLHESPQQLNAWLAEIEEVLQVALRLRLNSSKTILQPLERGVDVVGQVIKPWRRTLRRRTHRETLRRLAATPAPAFYRSANSYFGLYRQSTHSHADRAELARLVASRGRSVDAGFTKTYRLPHERSI